MSLLTALGTWWNETVMGPGGHVPDWIGCVLILVAVFVFNRLLYFVLKGVTHQLNKNSVPWDGLFVQSLTVPLRVFIWVLGVSYVADWLLSERIDWGLGSVLTQVRLVALVAALIWTLYRFTRLAEKESLARKVKIGRRHLSGSDIRSIAKFSRVILVIVLLIMLLQVLDVPLSGILTFGGIGAATIALASKDMLGNFFGGLLVYFDRPFSVGEWVRLPEQQLEGTVEHIGWRMTRIRTFDQRPLYVPNSVFTQIAIENPSRMLNRRIDVTLGVRYCDSSRIEAILSDMRAYLTQHDEIDLQKTLMVNLVNLSSSSLDIMVYAFTKTTEWVQYQNIREEVLLHLLHLIESHGASCAFPTTTLDLPSPVITQHVIEEASSRT